MPSRAPHAGTARVFAFPRVNAPYRDAEGSSDVDVGADSLRDIAVLLVEDDFIVAFDMQTLLEEQGALVIGPSANLHAAQAAFAAARSAVQLAVLDVNLNGEYVFPLAAELQAAGIPFVFATAYADDEHLFPEQLRDIPRLSKPVLPNALIAQLQRLLM